MDLTQLIHLSAALRAADAEIEGFHGEMKRLDLEMIPTQAAFHPAVRTMIHDAEKVVNEAIKTITAGVKV